MLAQGRKDCSQQRQGMRTAHDHHRERLPVQKGSGYRGHQKRQEIPGLRRSQADIWHGWISQKIETATELVVLRMEDVRGRLKTRSCCLPTGDRKSTRLNSS